MFLTFRRIVPVIVLLIASLAFVVTQVFALSFTYGKTVLWGGTHDDTAQRLVRDSSGNLYVLGWFQSSSVDFDPGEGTDVHTSTSRDIYVSKFTSDQEHIWTKTFVGDSIWDGAYGLAVDESNNALYIAGSFDGTLDMDPGAGTQSRSNNNGYMDAFLVKLNLNGEYVWDFVIDGSQNQIFEDVAIDDDGGVYIAGWADGLSGELVDLDPGAGSATFDPDGEQVAFVAKYTTDGEYIWSQAVLGDGLKIYNNIEVSGGKVYLSGYLSNSEGESTDYNPGLGVDNHSSPYFLGSIISTYSTDGDYQWTRSIVPGELEGDIGSLNLRPANMVVDQQGGVYIGGTYFSTQIDFDATEGTDIHTGSGSGNAFLTKYNADGSYGWTRTLNVGMDEDRVESIAVSSEGAVFAAGYIGGDDIYDFNGTDGEDRVLLGSAAAFVTQYSTDGAYGDTLLFLRGNNDKHVPGLVATNNSLWIAGDTDRTADFDGTAGVDVLGPDTSRQDAFITRYGYTTATLPGSGSEEEPPEEAEERNELLPLHQWTKTWGSEDDEHWNTTATDGEGNIYLVGHHDSENIDLNPGEGTDLHEQIPDGGDTLVAVKLDHEGNYLWGEALFGSLQSIPIQTEVDSEGSVYISGYFRGVNFDIIPGEATLRHTTPNNGNVSTAFLLKLSNEGEFEWIKMFEDEAESSSGSSLTIDSHDNIFLGVETNATTLDANPNEETDEKNTDGKSSVVVKLTKDGEYLWGRLLGNATSLNEMQTGSDDSLYIGGSTIEENVTFEGSQEVLENSSGNRAVFISKFDTDGNYTWGRIISSEYDNAYVAAFELDSSDAVYLGGDFYGEIDLDATEGVDLFTPEDDYGDGYFVKYDSDGNYQYGMSTAIPHNYEEVSLISVYGGYAYYGGYTDAGIHDFDPSTGEDVLEVFSDATFLTQVNAETGAYVGTFMLTNFDFDAFANAIALYENTLIVAGEFSRTEVIFGGTETEVPHVGGSDFFVSQYTLSQTEGEEEGQGPGTVSSTRNRFAVNPGSCSAVAPSGTPDLFQIDMHSSSATLYFTPSEHMNHYWVTYGMGDSSDQFGTKVWMSDNGGAIKVEINELQPSTEYSFQILPVNDCMPGDWSNILKTKTAARPTVKATSFYAHTKE